MYDSANQLIRENNQEYGYTHTWTYDETGNILNRKEYAYTTGALGTPIDTVTYSYDDYTWGDLLTGYDGQEIVLDEMGNPDDDGVWGYCWAQGRELCEMVSEDEDGRSLAWGFTYDANGMRTERSDYNEDITYYYVYNGSSLSQMMVGNNTLYFAYGANGVPMSVTYNNVTYYYVVNIQGDIIAILNAAGTPVVHYSYDAWGNHLSISGSMASTLGTLNPLRYRGYVYDQETGLYYLQSRYYNPEWGRFLNADSFVSTGQGLTGNNMFAYCGNNPVNYFDKTGRAPDSLAGWAGAAIGEWLYELFTGRTHPNKQAREIETQIIQKQNKIVADTGKAIWDGYMRGYDIQQESQTIESQMILDGATKIYKYYDEKEKLQQGVSAGKKIITGARNIYSGAVAILAPAPTPIEDVIGVNKITWGIIKVCYGIVEAISTLVG